MNNPATVPKWESIKVLAIESTTGNNKLYANGRQQIELAITVQVVDINGVPVPLTNEELYSIKLIQHADNRPITYEWGPGELIRPSEWRWTRVYNRDYKFLSSGPTSFSYSTRAANLHERRLIVYLRTTHLTPIKLALEMVRRDGVVFRSNNPDLEKGAITLQPVAPRTYKPNDYSFQRTVMEGDPDSRTQFDGHDYYPLELNEDGVRVEFSEFNFKVEPRTVFRLDIAPKDRGSYTGISSPGSPYINYHPRFNFGRSPTQLVPSYIKPGGIVVVVVRRDRIVLSGQVPVVDEPMILNAIDMYGNVHNLRIRFQGTDRKFLELI